jgi:DNA-binding GntR family transcriptional regulator
MEAERASADEAASVRRPNLKQEAAQLIRDLILSGQLRPGQKIDQDAIALQLGTSRLPVRESLITLETEGLIENVPRRGAFVAALSRGDISDHYEMYGLLSGMAAERAANALDEDAFQRLSNAIDQMRETNDARERDSLNYTFHREINRAGSSRRLAAVLRTLSLTMPVHFFEYHEAWEPHAEEEHRQILAALRERDGVAAAKAVSSHFRNIGEQAAAALEARGFWSGDLPNTPAAERVPILSR